MSRLRPENRRLGGLVAAWAAAAVWFLVPGPVEGRAGASLLLAVCGATLVRPFGGVRISRSLFYFAMLLLGQQTFRPALTLTLSDWALFGALAALGVEILRSRRRPTLGAPPLVLLGSLCVLVGAGVADAHVGAGHAATGAAARLVFDTVVLVALASSVLEREEHFRTAIAAWTVSAACSGVAAVVQIFDGSAIPHTHAAWGRATGFAQHVNDLGSFSAFALIMSACSIRSRVIPRWAQLVVIALTLVGLGLSGSVSGWVVAIVGLAVSVWAVWRTDRPKALTGRRMVLGLAGFVGVVVIVLGLQAATGAPSPLKRITESTSASSANSATLRVRLESMRYAWHEIRADPFFGRGVDPEVAKVANHVVVHNIVLGVWAAMGLLSAVGVLIVLAGFARQLWGLVGASRGTALSREAVGTFGAFLASVLYAMGSATLYQRFSWTAAILGCAIWAFLRRPIAAAAEEVSAEDAPGTGLIGARLREVFTPRVVTPSGVSGARAVGGESLSRARHEAGTRGRARTPRRVSGVIVVIALCAVSSGVTFLLTRSSHAADGGRPAGTPLSSIATASLASVHARQWAYVSCGPSCTKIRLVRRVPPVWEIDATYVGHPACYLMNVVQFAVHGARFSGVLPISCLSFPWSLVHGPAAARAAMSVAAWARYNCASKCQLGAPVHAGGATWWFTTRYASGTECWVLDAGRFAEFRGRFAGFSKMSCNLEPRRH